MSGTWWHQSAGHHDVAAITTSHVTTWEREHAEPWERSVVRDTNGKLWRRTYREIEPWQQDCGGQANWIYLLNYRAPLTLVRDGSPTHWTTSQWNPEIGRHTL